MTDPKELKRARTDWEHRGFTIKEISRKRGINAFDIREAKEAEKWVRKPSAIKRGKHEKKVAKEFMDEIDSIPKASENEKLFVLHYFKSRNATQSYLKAYPNSVYATASVEGIKLLARPRVKKIISQLQQYQREALFFDVTDITREYAKQAFSDITDYLTFGSKDVPLRDSYGGLIYKDKEETELFMKTINFVSLHDSDSVDGTLIKKVTQGQNGISIELYDKQVALDKLNDQIGGGYAERIRLMEERTNKIVAERKRITGEHDQELMADDGFIEALGMTAGSAEVWGDYFEP